MTDSSRSLLTQTWIHSREEDSGDDLVFRPETYAFPLARGRNGFQLHQDGTMKDLGIGPDDRPKGTGGTWHLPQPGELVLQGAGAGQQTLYKIKQLSADKLIVSKA